ncbi:dihydrodipicolinate synthase [Kockovaella imperatae]|uniref:Dihydrodipicolinate synthase n=1 Tax=Kockovaella imperatae TaxID=4999 RepID=A0A1Y1UBH5_9TREE|nr:dihydrodipicolinate synthase [Kockovaella imperatae]ORX35393.1 dihydrodipicolinate synthase [Kockovaella imperatae]
MTQSNGSSHAQPKWPNGPGVPLTTPFKPGNDEIDHEALASQVVRCAKAGLSIVLMGTTGEASMMSNAERKAAAATGRKALDEAGLKDAPLCVGTGGGSAQTTIELCKEAAEAGASHALVICPGYFAFAMGQQRQAILGFFKAVFDKSPIPVMIYNFPGAASGIDLTAEEICELAEHPNCFGVKLTCGNIGKGTRVALYTSSPEFLKRRGEVLKKHTETGQFQIGPGFVDTLLPALTARHTMCITSTGCLFPKTIRKLYLTAVKGLEGDMKSFQEARVLQDRLARADGISVATSFVGNKFFLDHYISKGLGGECRLPLAPITDATKKRVIEEFAEDWEFEQSLP